MDEIISGVQVIKMYAWEKSFCSLIETARRLELKVVRKSSYIRGIYMTFNVFTTRMALYCTIVAMMVLSNQNLTSARIFVFTSYFNILAHTMSGMFVRGIAEIAECMVAVRRLQNFLTFEEFQSGNVSNDSKLLGTNGTSNMQCKTYKNLNEVQFINDGDGFDERKGRSDYRQSLAILPSDHLKKETGDIDNNNTNNK